MQIYRVKNIFLFYATRQLETQNISMDICNISLTPAINTFICCSYDLSHNCDVFNIKYKVEFI